MIDLLVAGGGPVGLATALYARRAGLSVEVVEPRAGTIDKACGEGLMPGAVAALEDLNVRFEGHPIAGIRYCDSKRSVHVEFRAGPGRGVRRTALHTALADAARAEGVVVHTRPMGPVTQDDRGVYADGLAASYLAAADGLHSPLRRSLELDAPTARRRRYGLRAHYPVAPWTSFVEVHWADDLEAYVTPVAAESVGVAILTQRRAPFSEQLRAFPHLVDRLHGTTGGETRGAGPLQQRSRSRVCGRVLLVGDAAGYVDALTGEGISVGMASARALVDCLAREEPQAYERKWRQASRRYRWLTSSLLWARSHRATASAIVPAAERLPRVFAAAVNQLAK
ncbi:MAG: NAD(P)/FAD-dependent oxidoreductase [Nocardioidaceae bacterium]|nr:NAD(P)/FAD-dependent oxidoreductase [Nocardioidaceae bacterium]